MVKIITYFIFLMPLLLEAQIEQPKRVEIELEQTGNSFYIISANEKGLVLFRETNVKMKEGNVWEVHKYDTALNNQWVHNFPVKYGTSLLGYEYSDENLYLLFTQGEYNTNMLMIKLSLQTQDTTHFYIEKLFPIELTEFMIFDNTMIMGGTVNYRPAVIYYGLEEKKMRVLPGFYNNQSELLEINVDRDLKIFNVLLSQKMKNKRYNITLKTFNAQGELIYDKKLEPNNLNSFLSGKSSKLSSNKFYLTGTYAERKSSFSRGIFFAQIEPNKPDNVKYHNFGDLRNFFSYMRAKRENRVKSRIERRKILGKKLKFNYRVLVHDIIEKNDQYILLGEAYYPKYNNDVGNNFQGSFSQRSRYSSNRNRTDYSFEGYKYTHAVVIGFDKNGNVLWDNSFEINDVESYTLDKFVHVNVKSDQIVLLYIYENVIRSKIIQGNDVLEGKVFNEIQLSFDDDVANQSDSQLSGLEEWYGKYFYAFGVQKIKNLRDRGVKLNRKVFYINKITYE